MPTPSRCLRGRPSLARTAVDRRRHRLFAPAAPVATRSRSGSDGPACNGRATSPQSPRGRPAPRACRSTVSRKLLQWNCVWNPRMLLPSSPSSSSCRHGQIAKDSGLGHGMCQKVMIGRLWQPFADHPRQQREVVVLHQHDRIVGARLGDDRVGEPPVDGAIVLEVARSERRAHVRVVAERPQSLVGKAAVVAGLLVGAEPDAPQPVRRRLGRNVDAIVGIDGLAVGRAAAVRDPGARARTHHRLQRGHEAAGRALDADALGGPDMDERLAIADGDDVVAPQLAVQRRAQQVLRPESLRAVERAVLALEVADQLAQIASRSAAARAPWRRRGAGFPRPAAARAVPAPSRATRAGR